MKKIATFLSLILMAFVFVLSGCSQSIGLVGMPSPDAVITGNGGFVVQKGDYIYFANALTNYSNIGTSISNEEGEVIEYGLYRVKVSDANNKTINYSADGYATNVEQVVSKVVGFENSGFYIVDDYLYFASPNMHKTSSNQNRYDLISIFRVKLDGTDLKELYTTNDYTNGDWTILTINNSNYLITIEGKEIIRHDINENGILNKKILVNDSSKAFLADENKEPLDEYIFYTSALSQTDIDNGITGNCLKRVEIATGKIHDEQIPVGTTITLIKYSYGKLFYTRKTPIEDAYYFVKSGLTSADLRLTWWTDITELNYLENGPVAYIYDSKIVFQHINSFDYDVLVETPGTSPKIILTSGDYVFYSNSEGIFRVSYKDKTSISICTGTFEKYDFDGRFIYTYAKAEGGTTETKYLQRIDTFAIEKETEKISKIVGFVLQVDKKTEVDEAEEEVEENA